MFSYIYFTFDFVHFIQILAVIVLTGRRLRWLAANWAGWGASIYQDLPRSTEIYRDLPRFTKIYD